MSTEEKNKEIGRQYMAIWGTGDADLIDRLIAPDYVDHDPAMAGTSGPDGVKQVVAGYRAGFPDLRFTVEDEIAEGDRVVTRWVARGTHWGELMGIAPTGKQVEISGIAINRIVDGRIVESWGNWDTLGLLQQVGAIPPMG